MNQVRMDPDILSCSRPAFNLFNSENLSSCLALNSLATMNYPINLTNCFGNSISNF